MLKENKKLLLGIIIGLIVSGTVVYATGYAFAGSGVSFDNTNAGITLNDQPVDNIQDALDGIYDKVNTQLNACQTSLAQAAKNNTVYYEFGIPTRGSTTDYTTLNKKVFVGLNGSQKSVCIIRNSKLHCFDINNWPIEKDHVQQVFNDISCEVDPSDHVGCDADDFYCYIGSAGDVYCSDYLTEDECRVRVNSYVECYGY